MYSGLVLTTTIPARSAPNMAIGYCSVLGSMIAMRSPLLKPACCSQAANARLRSLELAVGQRRTHLDEGDAIGVRSQAVSISSFSERSWSDRSQPARRADTT